MPNVLHANIFCDIRRQFFKIREARAQAVAVEKIRMDPGVFEEGIGYPPGTSEPALVIQLDGIRGQVSEFVIREFILDRVNISRPRLDIRKITIRRERPVLIDTA